MTHIPALDLTTEIATQVASLTAGTNLFHGQIRAAGDLVPRNGVFAWGGGGLEPLRTMGDPDEIRKAVVHVRVRNSSYLTGSTLAHSIMDSMRGVAVATYLDVYVAISEPRSMGQDPNGNHYFGMEYVMTYQEP